MGLGAPNLSLGNGGKPGGPPWELCLIKGGGLTGAGGRIGMEGGLDKSCLTLINCLGRLLFTRVIEISAGISNGSLPALLEPEGSSSSISNCISPERNRISPGSSCIVISGVIIISSEFAILKNYTSTPRTFKIFFSFCK